MPGAASHIGHLRPGSQGIHQPGNLGQVGAHQQRVVFGPPHGVHGAREMWSIVGIRHPVAGAERIGNIVDALTQPGEHAAHGGQVGEGGAGEPHGVLGRQRVLLRRRVERGDAADRDGGQPLANVALRQGGGLGQSR